MAGEGAGAELRLRVSLDLTSLRRQLATIGTQLAGQPLAVNVKFDRSKIVSEFRLLDRYIRGKKFYVEVNTNLKTEVDRAAKLTELLKNMPRGGGAARTPGVVEAGFSQAQLRKLKQDIKPLYRAAADAGLIAFDEAIAKNVGNIARELSTVGKSSITGLLNGLASGDAQVRAAAQDLGQILIATIKATLGIASPSKETGKLGKFAAEGFEKGFISGIVKAERTMANAIRTAVISSIREGLSNLPGLGGALVGFERQLAASVQLAVRRAMRDGMRASIAPGAKGTLLGGAGGATTGAAIGGAKALGGGIAGGVAKLTAGGLMGTAANLARYSLDSSAYQEFVGKLYQEIINSALSSGTQGAVIGALAVGGVAGGLGFARGATGSLVLQAATAIRNRILAALLAVSTGDLNNIVKVMVRDVTGALFTNTIRQLRSASLGLPKINWPAIAPASTIGTGPSSSGRLLSAGADPRMLGAAAPPAGLLPSISQTTARRSSIATGLEAIFAAGGPTFPEGPPGKLALTPEALKRRIDAILAEYFKTVEVEVQEVFDGPVLKKALTVFSYLAQALQDAEKRARGLLGSFGRERTYTGRLAVDPQVSSRPYQRILPPAITRLLSAGREAITGVGAQEQVVRNFYKQLRESAQIFAENFSANSYLPQATRKLAGAMEGAAATLKALSAGRVAGVLPSREMLDARKFASAIQKAIVIDMQNALATQMSGRLLPAAGGTRGFQRMMQGTPTFRAPDVGPGRSKPDVSGKVLPIEDIIQFKAAIQEAAIIDARNAARAALKSIRREMFRALLPAAGMTGRARQAPPVAGVFATEARETERQFGTLRYSLAQAIPALPPAGMTGLSAAQTARVQQAYARSAARGAAVMGGGPGGPPSLPPGIGGGGLSRARRLPSDGMIPMGPSTAIGPGSQMGKFKAAIEAAEGGMKKFRASQLPFVGGLRELAGEFGMATKQVLLYGAAYKGLAFVTSLPGQIINAAKGQQQFANAMQVATQETNTFAKEMLYVDNVQRAFGLNLETTRTGFTRLYASMAPAGFDSGSIEKLFTGISAASAALQLTPDKAERVIYAFGQMASKGQVMSEELKGQLGDVLPGALAIFAKAAGKSVKEFNKEIEDGIYSGSKFRELMAGVTDELIRRFGTAAQVAGKSLQGLLNTVQGEFVRTLEALTPLANTAAQSILGPLGGALRQFSTAARVAMGETTMIAKQIADAEKVVKDLREGGAKASEIQGAQQSLAALQATQEQFNVALQDPAVRKQAEEIKAFIGEMVKLGTAISNVVNIIGSVLNPVLTFLGTNLTTAVTVIGSLMLGFNAMKLSLTVASGALVIFNGLVKAAAGGAAGIKALAMVFQVLGLQISAANIKAIGFGVTVKALLVSTGIGALVVLLGTLAAAFLTVGNNARKAADDARAAVQQIREAAAAGDVASIQMRAGMAKADLETVAALQRGTAGMGRRAGRSGKQISVSELEPLRGQFATVGIQLPAKGTISAGKLTGELQAIQQARQSVVREASIVGPAAEARRKRLGLDQPTPSPTTPEAPSTKGDSKAEKAAERLAEQIARQAQAAADALFNERQRLATMQATDPTAKALAEYASQELVIQRELNQKLKEAKSEQERQDLIAEAGVKRQINALSLDQQLADARKQAMQPLEDALRNQREQLLVEEDIKNLVAQGMVPERAKEVAEMRKLTRAVLKQIDAQIKQLDIQVETLDEQIKLTKLAILEREAREGSTKAVEALREQLKQYEKEREEAERRRKKAEEDKGKTGDMGKQAEKGVPEAKAKGPKDFIIEAAGEAQKELAKLTNWGFQAVEGAKAIGSAFGQAFKDIASGSMSAQEALANMMQSIADHFLDMAAQIIAQQTVMIILGAIMKALGVSLPGSGGGGGGGGGFSGNAAGFGGSFDAGIPALPGVPDYSGIFKKAANGAVWEGGFQAFANGGIVNGPTLGLVGEGKYNEAIVPLPDGRSIPVQFQGENIRDKMGGSYGSSPSSPVLSMSFETTTINGVEYVSREQLEAAMMETRRMAVKEGSVRGANLAIDKLQQSPNTRRRVGMR